MQDNGATSDARKREGAVSFGALRRRGARAAITLTQQRHVGVWERECDRAILLGVTRYDFSADVDEGRFRGGGGGLAVPDEAQQRKYGAMNRGLTNG